MLCDYCLFLIAHWLGTLWVPCFYSFNKIFPTQFCLVIHTMHMSGHFAFKCLILNQSQPFWASGLLICCLLPLGTQLYYNWQERAEKTFRSEFAKAWTWHEVIQVTAKWNAQYNLHFSLTCLTLFFELPTRKIPTVWRPANKQTKSTALFYGMKLWTKSK